MKILIYAMLILSSQIIAESDGKELSDVFEELDNIKNNIQSEQDELTSMIEKISYLELYKDDTTKSLLTIQEEINGLTLNLQSLSTEIQNNISKINTINNTLNELDVRMIQDHYDLIFNNWFTIQMMIMTFFGLLGIALTILTYLLGIKPAKDIEKKLENLENNIERKIHSQIKTYLEHSEIFKLNESIDKLLSPNLEEKNFAIKFLSNNLISDFTPDILEKVYNILSNSNPEPQPKFLLEKILVSKKNIYSDTYVTKILNSKTSILQSLDYLSKYLAHDNYSNKEYLTKIIECLGNNLYGLSQVLSYAGNVDKKHISNILNTENLHEIIEEDDRVLALMEIEKVATRYNSEYKDTVLYKKLNNLK